MSQTTFVNGVTLTDAGWMNDVDSMTYTPTLDARRASVYKYTAWDPSDVAGAFTNASSSSAATITAADYITVANASGTLTFTCVKAGTYRFTVSMENECLATAGILSMRATLGGTGTLVSGSTVPYLVSYSISGGITNGGISQGGTYVFWATLTAAQTVTVLPAVAVTSGGVTTNFTQQCTVSAEYTGKN